jgi:hypothetical protein
MGKIMEAWGSLYPTNSSSVDGIGAELSREFAMEWWRIREGEERGNGEGKEGIRRRCRGGR